MTFERLRPIGLVVFLSGMLATLAGAPFFVWPAGVVSLAFLYGLVRLATSRKQALGAGLLWGMGWQLSALYWLPRAFYMDAGNDFWAAALGGGPALLGLAFYGALGVALVCLLAYRAGPRWRGLVFGTGWVGLEVLKSLSPYGFPWLPVGAWLANSPVMAQAASLGGVYLLSALLVSVAVLVNEGNYRRVAMAVVLVALAAGFGTWRLYNAPPQGTADREAMLVRVVQPGLTGLHKWEASTRYAFLQRTLDVAFPKGLEKRPDLIVMPETAVAFYLDEEAQIKELVAGKLAPGQLMLTGTVRREVPPLAKRPEEVRFYNSLMALDGSGKIFDVYDKHLLVPFGEEIPFHAFLNRLPLPIIRTVSESRLDYARGTAPNLLATPKGAVVGLICYEGIFPFYVAHWASQARLLLNITNDNWFTGTIALDQHAALAKLRAIETGKPLVRAANTGISLIVDGYGRETARLPVGGAALMDVPLPVSAPGTVFVRLISALSN